jgi:hypothetical protein
MSKMSELFYDLLEMLELGRTDSDISLATGFPVEAIAIWRADAELRPESASEESDWQQDTGPGDEDDGWDDDEWFIQAK